MKRLVDLYFLREDQPEYLREHGVDSLEALAALTKADYPRFQRRFTCGISGEGISFPAFLPRAIEVARKFLAGEPLDGYIESLVGDGLDYKDMRTLRDDLNWRHKHEPISTVAQLAALDLDVLRKYLGSISRNEGRRILNKARQRVGGEQIPEPPAADRSGSWQVFLWTRLGCVSDAHHGAGGLVVVERGLEAAIEYAVKVSDDGSLFCRSSGWGCNFVIDEDELRETEPTAVFEIVDGNQENEPRVYVFPDAGCC